MKNYFDGQLVMQDVKTGAEFFEKWALQFSRELKTMNPVIKKQALQRMKKSLKNKPQYFEYCKELVEDSLGQIQINSVKIHKQRVNFHKQITYFLDFAKHKDDQNNRNICEISKEGNEQSPDEQDFLVSNVSPPEIIQELNQEQEEKDQLHSQQY